MITRAIIYASGTHLASVKGRLYDPMSDDLGDGMTTLRRSLEEAFSIIAECEEIEVVFPEIGETFDDQDDRRQGL